MTQGLTYKCADIFFPVVKPTQQFGDAMYVNISVYIGRKYDQFLKNE